MLVTTTAYCAAYVSAFGFSTWTRAALGTAERKEGRIATPCPRRFSPSVGTALWVIFAAVFRDFLAGGAVLTLAVYMLVSRVLFVPHRHEHTIEQRVEWCVGDGWAFFVQSFPFQPLSISQRTCLAGCTPLMYTAMPCCPGFC